MNLDAKDIVIISMKGGEVIKSLHPQGAHCALWEMLKVHSPFRL
jgi:hypothetical protein